MIAIIPVRFTTNADATSVWSFAAFTRWFDPEHPFSLAHYWKASGWGLLDVRADVFPEIVMDDPRGAGLIRDLLAPACIKKAASALNLRFDRYDIVLLWFAQKTDAFGGGTEVAPLSNGGTKSVFVTVLDTLAPFSICCQELGHSFGFSHEVGPSGNEYASPYSSMSARTSDAEFLRPADPLLPDGTVITDHNDPYIGNFPQRVIGPLLPAAQMYAFPRFRTSRAVVSSGFEQGRSLEVTLHALDVAQARGGTALLVLTGVDGRCFGCELRRSASYDQGVTPAVVIHSFTVDGAGSVNSRVVFERALALPNGDYADWPVPQGGFTLRLWGTAADQSSVQAIAFAGVWTELDANGETQEIAAAGSDVYQRHRDGSIFRYTGVPYAGWELLDNNPDTVKIAVGPLHYRPETRSGPFKERVSPAQWQAVDASGALVDIGDHGPWLYQLHRTGNIYRYTGNPRTGWELLDANPDTVDIVADGMRLYQRHRSGRVYRYTGTPRTGWELLDSNSDTVKIVAGGGLLYQLHRSGRTWAYTGSPRWQELDANPDTADIMADGRDLYQLHKTGHVYRYTGTPHTGWTLLDKNVETVALTAADGTLFQRHRGGRIWRHVGTPWWFELDHNPASHQIVATPKMLYQLHNPGRIWALPIR